MQWHPPGQHAGADRNEDLLVNADDQFTGRLALHPIHGLVPPNNVIRRQTSACEYMTDQGDCQNPYQADPVREVDYVSDAVSEHDKCRFPESNSSLPCQLKQVHIQGAQTAAQ